MNDTVYKIKIWTKLILIGLLILFVTIFSLENYHNPASFWFFGTHQTTVLELLAATFLCGVIATLLARPTWRTIRQISELTKENSALDAPAPAIAPPSPSTPSPAAKP